MKSLTINLINLFIVCSMSMLISGCGGGGSDGQAAGVGVTSQTAGSSIGQTSATSTGQISGISTSTGQSSGISAGQGTGSIAVSLVWDTTSTTTGK